MLKRIVSISTIILLFFTLFFLISNKEEYSNISNVKSYEEFVYGQVNFDNLWDYKKKEYYTFIANDKKFKELTTSSDHNLLDIKIISPVKIFYQAPNWPRLSLFAFSNKEYTQDTLNLSNTVYFDHFNSLKYYTYPKKDTYREKKKIWDIDVYFETIKDSAYYIVQYAYPLNEKINVRYFWAIDKSVFNIKDFTIKSKGEIEAGLIAVNKKRIEENKWKYYSFLNSIRYSDWNNERLVVSLGDAFDFWNVLDCEWIWGQKVLFCSFRDVNYNSSIDWLFFENNEKYIVDLAWKRCLSKTWLNFGDSVWLECFNLFQKHFSRYNLDGELIDGFSLVDENIKNNTFQLNRDFKWKKEEYLVELVTDNDLVTIKK